MPETPTQNAKVTDRQGWRTKCVCFDQAILSRQRIAYLSLVLTNFSSDFCLFALWTSDSDIWPLDFWPQLTILAHLYSFLGHYAVPLIVTWSPTEFHYTMKRNLPKPCSVLKFWINLLNFSLKNFWQTVKKLIFVYFY